MTIHITPEPDFSYVSFESNIPLASYSGVIQRVLDTFLPGKFVLTIFANRVCRYHVPYLIRFSQNLLVMTFHNIIINDYILIQM